MTKARLLSASEFEACFARPMRDVTTTAEPILDIWPYVDALKLSELGLTGTDDVRYVYRDAHERYDQVLIGTSKFNALLVVVIDRVVKQVTGHHLLDLGELYGTETEDPSNDLY